MARRSCVASLLPVARYLPRVLPRPICLTTRRAISASRTSARTLIPNCSSLLPNCRRRVSRACALTCAATRVATYSQPYRLPTSSYPRTASSSTPKAASRPVRNIVAMVAAAISRYHSSFSSMRHPPRPLRFSLVPFRTMIAAPSSDVVLSARASYNNPLPLVIRA